MAKQSDWQVKGVSAPPEWWDKVEEGQERLGISSRSNLIRIAVDDYLKGSLVDNRETAPVVEAAPA